MEEPKNPVKPRQAGNPGRAWESPKQDKQDLNRGPEQQMRSQKQESNRGCDRPDELDEALDAENHDWRADSNSAGSV
jgi:hypothetical protein